MSVKSKDQNRFNFFAGSVRRFGAVFLFAIFIINIGISLTPFIPQVSAEDKHDYTIYYPKEARSDLTKAHEDRGGIGDNDTGGPLGQTVLFTKGGQLGAQALRFDANASDSEDMPIYTMSYYCTEGGNKTIVQPESTKLYAKINMMVGLGDDHNWKEMIDGTEVRTFVGVNKDNAGTLHIPEDAGSDEPGASDGGASAQDIKLEGAGTKSRHNMATVLNYTGMAGGITGNISTKLLSLGDCLPKPIGEIGNKTSVYERLGPEDKKDWQDKLRSGGYGDSVEEAVAAIGSETTGDGGLTGLDCKAGINPLNWLICGVVQGLVSLIGVMDNLIMSQMTVGSQGSTGAPNQIFCSSTVSEEDNPKSSCAAYHEAWRSFRNIALGLLILAGLAVLISQAVGTEILDAYTIKKVLPRFLIAAVAITVSWQLMQFFVQLSNDLGLGIRNLIESPFRGITDDVQVGNLGITLATAGAITVLGIFGLLSFVATAALALIIGFLILVLREIVIILLIIVAPLAIVMYILPRTQKMYKIWWESFSKALLMFPLIVGLIAVGRVFAQIAADGSSENPIQAFVAYGAYFAPYFVLPLTFKFAGSALGQIGGFVNDRSRGGFDRLRKYRGDKGAANIKKARAGQRWNEDFAIPLGKKKDGTQRAFRLGHYANRAALNAVDQDELIPYRVGKSGFGKATGIYRATSERLQDTIDDGAMEQTKNGYKHIQENGGIHHTGWRALAGDYGALGATGAQLQAKFGPNGPVGIKQFEEMAHIMSQSDDQQIRLGGEGIERNLGAIGAVKRGEGSEYVSVQGMGMVGLAAAGYATPENVTEFANKLKKESPGLAQRIVAQTAAIGSGKRPDLADGHGVVRDKNGNYVSVYAENGGRSEGAVNAMATRKQNDWTMAKGQIIAARAETLKYAMSDEYINNVDNMSFETPEKREEARELRKFQKEQFEQLIASQGGTYGYAEPAAKAEWSKLADELGIQLVGGTDGQRSDAKNRFDAANNAEQANRFGSGGPAGMPGAPLGS